jgi:hypothetical protein
MDSNQMSAAAPTPRRRGRANKVAAVFVASGLAVALLEGGLRLWLNGPVYQVAMPEIPELSRYRAGGAEDVTVIGDLGTLTTERADDVPRRVRTTIDAFGFRNETNAAERPVDLIVLGDSFGFGTSTTQAETFSSLLENRYGLAVYNLSMPHTGPWAQFVNLSLEAPRLRLRRGTVLVWTIFTGNDLDDPYGPLDVDHLRRNGFAGRAWIRLMRFRGRSPLYQLSRRAWWSMTGVLPPGSVNAVPVTFLNGRTALFARPYIDARSRDREGIAAHPNFGMLKDTVAAAKRLTDSYGVSLKIVLIPSKEEVYGWMLDGAAPWSTPSAPSALSLALREICASSSIDFLDLRPVFVIRSKTTFVQSGEMLWWYDDTHWNRLGHELAATAIHDGLLRHQAARLQ